MQEEAELGELPLEHHWTKKDSTSRSKDVGAELAPNGNKTLGNDKRNY